MKYSVKVEDKSYEVEIEDLNAKPILAHVDGQKFEVSLENGARQTVEKETMRLNPAEVTKQSSSLSASSSELTAPLPGTVIEIFVKAGNHIESGQIVLIIEAMKMKNSIRSTRAGKITEVLVTAGETVSHKQPLVRFG